MYIYFHTHCISYLPRLIYYSQNLWSKNSFENLYNHSSLYKLMASHPKRGTSVEIGNLQKTFPFLWIKFTSENLKKSMPVRGYTLHAKAEWHFPKHFPFFWANALLLVLKTNITSRGLTLHSLAYTYDDVETSVCCRVLQGVAVCCSALQWTPSSYTYDEVKTFEKHAQHIAHIARHISYWCIMLQYVAVCCSVLYCVAVWCSWDAFGQVCICGAVCSSVLGREWNTHTYTHAKICVCGCIIPLCIVAVFCSVLQCVGVCCSVRCGCIIALCIAMCYSVAVWCSVLHCVRVCCDGLQWGAS